MIAIGLTGTNAAGKDEVARLIEKLAGGVFFSLSDEIREKTRELGYPIVRENLRRIGNEFREKHGADYWARLAFERARKSNAGIAVFASLRSPAEVFFFKSCKDVSFFLISVDAPAEMRFKRIIERKRQGEATISFQEFREAEEKELVGNDFQQNVSACMKLADFTLFNDGTKEELEEKVRKLLKESLGITVFS